MKKKKKTQYIIIGIVGIILLIIISIIIYLWSFSKLSESRLIKYVEKEAYKQTGDVVSAKIISKEPVVVHSMCMFVLCFDDREIKYASNYNIEITNQNNPEISTIITWHTPYIYDLKIVRDKLSFKYYKYYRANYNLNVDIDNILSQNKEIEYDMIGSKNNIDTEKKYIFIYTPTPSNLEQTISNISNKYNDIELENSKSIYIYITDNYNYYQTELFKEGYKVKADTLTNENGYRYDLLTNSQYQTENDNLFLRVILKKDFDNVQVITTELMSEA